jgi:hypothetical protein
VSSSKIISVSEDYIALILHYHFMLTADPEVPGSISGAVTFLSSSGSETESI